MFSCTQTSANFYLDARSSQKKWKSKNPSPCCLETWIRRVLLPDRQPEPRSARKSARTLLNKHVDLNLNELELLPYRGEVKIPISVSWLLSNLVQARTFSYSPGGAQARADKCKDASNKHVLLIWNERKLLPYRGEMEIPNFISRLLSNLDQASTFTQSPDEWKS